MALVNHAKKEINAKIVYFGPPGSGKSTTLSYLYSRIKPSLRGELRSVPAGSDNLIFFDFSPFEVPLPSGYHLRLHIYTLTGMVNNPATWKMTLKGVDGVMLQLNPDSTLIAENRESIAQLRDFLAAYGVGLHDISAVMQFNSFESENKNWDAQQFLSELDLTVDTTCFSNSASGEGLIEALTLLSRQVLEKVTNTEHPIVTEQPHEAEPEAACETEPESVTFSEESKLDISVEDTLKITAQSENIVSEDGMIRIPLEIANGVSTRTVVVTVSVAFE